MDQNDIYNLLICYVDGEVTSDEAVIIEELLETSSYWKSEFEILKSVNLRVAKELDYDIDAQTNANWDNLKSLIEGDRNPKTIQFIPSLVKYAAAAIILFVAGWFLLKPSKNEFSTFVEGKAYKTGAKEISILTLEDGSKITLNQNSVLTLDKEYNKSNRHIKLSGEAYFEVIKNNEIPFIANTKNTFTKVLGTSFEIESNNSSQISITLFEGKIEFLSEKGKEVLTPGEKLSYSLENKSVEKYFVKSPVKDGWISSLSFKDVRLADIVKNLETRYNVTIAVPANKENELYTVSFTDLDLSASLQLLEELTDSKISKKDSDYILNP